jgi:hypothetical protein
MDAAMDAAWDAAWAAAWAAQRRRFKPMVDKRFNEILKGEQWNNENHLSAQSVASLDATKHAEWICIVPSTFNG